MGKLNKIKNVNLAELDENHTLKDSLEGNKQTKNVEQGPQVTEKMADPVGRHYNVDAEIDRSELRSFLMGHAFRQPMSYLLMLMGVAFGVYTGITQHNPFFGIVISAVILIGYPITIANKAGKIKAKNKTFSETFHYMFDEKGCHLQLSREAIDVEWKYFKKIMVTSKVAVIYTSAANGYIVPIQAMGAQKEEILSFLREKIK